MAHQGLRTALQKRRDIGALVNDAGHLRIQFEQAVSFHQGHLPQLALRNVPDYQ